MGNRYSRQTLFRPIGIAGQQQLEQSVVAVIGCGALGSAIAETLVRAGVGHLHLVDRDVVELSNLQRQVLFSEQHAKEMVPKVVAAKQRLREISSDVKLSIYMDHADGVLIEELAQKCHILMDATDNFETRLIINDVALKVGRPWIYGACVGSAGVVFPFIPGESACFRCLLPVLPSLNETCDTVGIIGPAVQTTAALQCVEALKWLTGNQAAMIRKVHHFDLWNNSVIDVGITRIKREDCPSCGALPTYPALSESEHTKFVVLCGRDTVQVIPDYNRTIGFDDAETVAKLAQLPLRRTPYFVELQASPYRMILFQNGRLLIHGLSDINLARRLYHQFFG